MLTPSVLSRYVATCSRWKQLASTILVLSRRSSVAEIAWELRERECGVGDYLGIEQGQEAGASGRSSELEKHSQ